MGRHKGEEMWGGRGGVRPVLGGNKVLHFCYVDDKFQIGVQSLPAASAVKQGCSLPLYQGSDELFSSFSMFPCVYRYLYTHHIAAAASDVGCESARNTFYQTIWRDSL